MQDVRLAETEQSLIPIRPKTSTASPTNRNSEEEKTSITVSIGRLDGGITESHGETRPQHLHLQLRNGRLHNGKRVGAHGNLHHLRNYGDLCFLERQNFFVCLERICHLVRTCHTLCCSRTCRLPRASHLPHSLFLLPRHQNTHHNRDNTIYSKNTHCIINLSKTSQTTKQRHEEPLWREKMQSGGTPRTHQSRTPADCDGRRARSATVRACVAADSYNACGSHEFVRGVSWSEVATVPKRK